MKTLARLHWKTMERGNFVLITFVLLNHTNLRGGGWGWWMSQDDVFLFRAIQSWNSYNKCVCVCVRVEFQFVLEFKLQLDPCSLLPGAKFSFWFIKLVRASKLSPLSLSSKGNLGNDRSRHNFSPIWIISFDCYSFDFLPKSIQKPDDTTGVVHFPPNWLDSEGVCRKQTPKSPENRTSTTRRARRTA